MTNENIEDIIFLEGQTDWLFRWEILFPEAVKISRVVPYDSEEWNALDDAAISGTEI